MALRADVLSRPAAGRLGAGAGDRPGRRPGRVVVPPLVHGWHRWPHATFPGARRHHALVPVPQHLRVPDLQPVQRAAAHAGTGSAIADRPPPRRAARLRARAQRHPTRDRSRARGQAIGRHVDRVARWRRRPEHAAQGRLPSAGLEGQDDRSACTRAAHPRVAPSPRSSPTSSAPSVRSRSGRRNHPDGCPSIRTRPVGRQRLTRTPPPRSRSATSRTARRGDSVGAARRATARTIRRAIQLFGKGGEYGDSSVKYQAPPASSTPDSTYLPAPGDLPYEPPAFDLRRLRSWTGQHDGAASARWKCRTSLAGLHHARLEGEPVAGPRSGLPGPIGEAIDPRRRRPGVTRRRVHRPSPDRQRRSAPAGVPALGGCHEALCDPANAAGRHPRRSQGDGQRRRSTTPPHVRSCAR